ncbi:MAG: 3-deoxy-7-phosphoheptulonate synthase [Chloroflexota bacterium]|nr:3-deoxy-7-phosphoheptulonate synthase [Chloroflexota bacterium]
MLITIANDAPLSTRSAILAAALERGFHAQAMKNGCGGEVIGIAGTLPIEHMELTGVEHAQPVHKPFMMASLEARSRSVVMVGDIAIGGDAPVFMAGPCSIESLDDQVEIARAVKAAGANILRGGAFKPRSSPYSFQGLGQEGLDALAAAREATGLPVVTEVMEPEQVDLVAGYADMLQIGSRNMANFPLLKRVGRTNTPILLKRGFAATQEEFLMSAEYIMAGGNTNVVLCERGIRAFDAAFRFSLDLNVVPSIREVSHLPIIVDPSHGTGRRSLVARMAMAGLAAGADGLMLEVHADPDNALSDGYQTITPMDLGRIHRRGMALLEALHGFDDADDLTPEVAAVTHFGTIDGDIGAGLERIA